MLDIRKNHIDFGEQLQPPPGYNIDYAIATTYSLDLYALLSIPLAMYYRQNLDSEISEDNFQVLESIQNLQKHLKLFCHKGKISLPKSTSLSLLSFVENCVIEVMPGNAYQSFHPKVWVLRFKASTNQDVLYRVIVMSRNLTFDKSYDIAFWMEGKPKGGKKSENKELVELLNGLNKNSEFEHKSFISDLAKVDFGVDDPFYKYTFSNFPKSGAHKSIDLNKTYNKRMVISPFLSKEMVNLLNEKSKSKLILFSRKNELDNLPYSLIRKIEPYCFEQEIVNHHLYEKAEEGEQDEYNGGEWDNNLHAKIFLRQDEEITYWDLGSANCSNAAFERNHEFLIHLQTKERHTNINAIKNELLQEYNGVRVFKPYERELEEIEVEPELKFRFEEYELLKCISNSKQFDAWIEANGNLYDILLELELPKSIISKDYTVRCNPLGQLGKGQIIDSKNVIRFEAIPLHKLSCFMHWKITAPNKTESLDLVTKIEIRNMPEYRLSNILKSIINNPDKFMALLKALLSNEPQSISVLDEEENKMTNNYRPIGHASSIHFNEPIYEDLLITLSRNPERLIRLAEVIEKLTELDEDKIIPQEFQQIWETIKEVLPNE